MHASLEGYAAEVLQRMDSSALRRLADDLFEVDMALASNHELRAAMTDTSVTGRVRKAVVVDVLSDKVSAPAIRLVGYAALVNHAQHVPEAVNYLAHRSRVTAAGEWTSEPTLSVGGARTRVGGFAAALFEDLEHGDLEEMEDELFRFARTVEGAPPLRRFLTDRDQSISARSGVVTDLLGAKVTDATLRLILYVIDGGRARDFVGTLDWLVDETARARGWRVAKVRTAQPLDTDQETQLKASLSRVTGNPVELQVSEDPSLVGGVRIEVGDLLVDATAKARLNQLREHLESDHRTFLKND